MYERRRRRQRQRRWRQQMLPSLFIFAILGHRSTSPSRHQAHGFVTTKTIGIAPFRVTSKISNTEIENRLNRFRLMKNIDDTDHEEYENEDIDEGSMESSSTARRQRQLNDRRLKRNAAASATTASNREVRQRRRQRRQQRLQQQQQQSRQLKSSSPTKLFSVVERTTRSVTDAVLPNRVKDVGRKATRIANRKARKMFDELVDFTYDDDDDIHYDSSSSRNIDYDDQDNEDRTESLKQRLKEKRRKKQRRLEELVRETNPGVIKNEDIGVSFPRDTSSADFSGDRWDKKEKSYKQTDDFLEDNAKFDESRAPVALKDLLAELNTRNIPYSPQATRDDLEQLLSNAKQSSGNVREFFDTSNSSSFDFNSMEDPSLNEFGHHPLDWDKEVYYVDQKEKKSKAGEWKKSAKSVSKKVSKAVQSTGKSTYQKAKSGVNNLFRNQPAISVTSVKTSEPIIVDAVVEDFSKEEDFWGDGLIDVEPSYYDTSRSSRRIQRKKQRYATGRRPKRVNTRQTNTNATRDRLRRNSEQRFNTPRERFDLRSSSSSSSSSTLPRLPPSNDSGVDDDTSFYDDTFEPKIHSPHERKNRKIYSPYQNEDLYVDSLDKFGDFVARSVDSIFWSDDNERASSRSPSSSAKKKKSPSKFEDSSDESSQNYKRKRSKGLHWKDRMEEQFDYLLGIHQDGDEYKRWIDDDWEREREAEGTDAVSYARGRTPRRERKRRQRITKKPLWEEDGSLLSILFGFDDGASLRNEQFYEATSFLGSGSLLKILRTAFRGSAIVASGICRWASVRGSIPQPLVLIGVLTATVCSRPGARLRNIILALVGIRSVAELLHGYAYDEEDFWDPDDDESAEGDI